MCILFVFSLCFAGCSKESDDPLQEEVPAKNENVLAKTLLYTDWASAATVMSMSYVDMRNTLISDLDSRCEDAPSFLQQMDDVDLCWGAMMYKFFLDADIFSAQQLADMTLEEYRTSIIDLNATKTVFSVSELQKKNNIRNLSIAYSWWFYQNTSSKQKIEQLNNVAIAEPSFDMKDDKGRVMDVLRIVKADESYTYLGVYHSMASTNEFILYLAGSNDLKNWINITELGDRSHQGDIKKWGNGYIVANEQDPIQGSNNIRVRYYASYVDLAEDKPTNDKTISQTFSNLAEGTPDIRKIEGFVPSSSHIVIGYHYYDNGIRDQQAFGILTDFSNWRTWKDEVSNFTIQEMGYKGNIGGRSAFSHDGDYVLQEAQITSGDWSSWRILFGNGAFYCTLQPQTPLGSASFANPGITPIESDKFVVTSFLPSQGNRSGEIGELVYIVQF
ncbi:hypothetical protein NC99_17510 [Sunxiuqinia dokdonensis]|uniref:Uncharacterized protein n=2 Tax=Sunxiuqinia dokdonensis TaxID=1409788 RepID=A0A0L8VAD5_9BACT|nr:hypothetical protein NC99_17510 [Sunxiuqinia dokdonensis]